MTELATWTLRNGGSFIAVHSTRLACVIEAFERGWVVGSVKDFMCDHHNGEQYLADGISIEKKSMEF